jgi:hypothetical protein
MFISINFPVIQMNHNFPLQTQFVYTLFLLGNFNANPAHACKFLEQQGNHMDDEVVDFSTIVDDFPQFVCTHFLINSATNRTLTLKMFAKRRKIK